MAVIYIFLGEKKINNRIQADAIQKRSVLKFRATTMAAD